MKRTGLGVVGLAVLMAMAQASPARAEEGAKAIRFGALFSSPTDDLSLGGQTTELDGEVGLHGSFEYLVTDMLGIEPAVSRSSHDVTVKQSGFPDLDLGEVDLLAVTASLNFHLLKDRKVDFFLGPTVGYAFWGDLETNQFPQDFSTDDEFLYGLNIGVDVPVGGGRKWAFTAGVNVLFVDLTVAGSSADIGVDPINVKAGAVVRF